MMSPMKRLFCLYSLVIRTPGVLAGFGGSKITESLSKVVEQAPCVRLFHSKGSVGCRTPNYGGTKAPLYMMEDFSLSHQDRIKSLKHPAAVVISSEMLNGSVLSFLAAQPTTHGVVVLEDWDQHSSFSQQLSPDVETPHGTGTPDASYTIGATYAWNSHGSGMAYQSYPFPIVLVTGDSVANVRSWARQNGQLGSKDYPRHTAAMDFYFGPSRDVTSGECLTWRDVDDQSAPQCLPLGGQSVWASVNGRTGVKNKNNVLLTAGMDSTSLFHDKAPGANDAAASLVAILAAVSALSSSGLSLAALPKNIVVGLFQAEEWGFAGSRRFVQDLTSFQCTHAVSPASATRDGAGACLSPTRPSLAFADLSLSAIDHVIAVDQVGLGASLSALHSSTQVSPSTLLASLNSAAAATPTITFASSPVSAALPPSPLTTLLLAQQGLSGVVLGGYAGPFADPRYHSHMDVHQFLDPASLTQVSTFLARAAYSAAGGADADLPTISANATLVSLLLDCLTQDWNCPLMAPYIKSEVSSLASYLKRTVLAVQPPSTPTFYAGVLSSYQGLPLVQVSGGKSDVSTLYADWGGAFDPAADKVFATPKPLEAFLRGFLSHAISGADTPGLQKGSCARNDDCDAAATCDGGLSTFECVAGTCVCRSLAFYHTALDPGLRPLQTPDRFEVSDASSPNWAEPNWLVIGMSVFPDTSPSVEAAALSVGIFTLLLSGAAAFGVQTYLNKYNALRRECL